MTFLDELDVAQTMGQVMDAFNRVETLQDVQAFIDAYGQILCDKGKAIENIDFGQSYCDSPKKVRDLWAIWKLEQAEKEGQGELGL